MNRKLLVVGSIGLLGIGYIVLSKRKSKQQVIPIIPVNKQSQLPTNESIQLPEPPEGYAYDSSGRLRKLPGTLPPVHVPTDAPSKLPTNKSPPVSGDFAQQVFQLTNQHRQSGGICGGTKVPPSKALVWDDRLAKSALNHAIDMANRGYFGHNTPEGIGPEQRILSAGWSMYPVGENIAEGQANPQEVITGWLNSPGHCTNLLRAEFGHIGIGYYYAPNTQYKHFWVQNFGG